MIIVNNTDEKRKYSELFGSIIEHVYNQVAVFSLGQCSNLTRSAWAYQNAEKSERQSRPID